MLSLRTSSLGTKNVLELQGAGLGAVQRQQVAVVINAQALDVLADRHDVAVRVALGAFCTATGRTITPPGYRFDAHDTEPFSFRPPSTRVPST